MTNEKRDLAGDSGVVRRCNLLHLLDIGVLPCIMKSNELLASMKQLHEEAWSVESRSMGEVGSREDEDVKPFPALHRDQLAMALPLEMADAASEETGGSSPVGSP
jgi:hypothetical protein